MKCNLAIGPGSKPVSRLFELLLNRLVTVEFTIDDNPKSFVFVRDRLISGRKVDNAETCVPETNLAVRCDPVTLAVGTSMTETLRSPLQCLCGNGGMW